MFRRRFLTRLTRLGLATYIMTYCMAFTVCAAENPIADLAVADSVRMVENQEDAETEDEVMPVPAEPDETDEAIAEEEADDSFFEDEYEEADDADDVFASVSDEEASEEEDELQDMGTFSLDPALITFTLAGSEQITLTHTGDDTPDYNKISYLIADSADSTEQVMDDWIASITVRKTETGCYLHTSPVNYPQDVFYINAIYEDDGVKTVIASCKVKLCYQVIFLDLLINGTIVNGNSESAILISNISEPINISVKSGLSVLVADKISWKAFENGTSEVGSSVVGFNQSGNDTSCCISFSEGCRGKTYKIKAEYDNSYTDVSGENYDGSVCEAEVYFNISGAESDYFYNITKLYMNKGNITVSESTVGSENAVKVKIGAAGTSDDNAVEAENLDPAKIVFGLIERSETNISKASDELYGLKISQSSTDPCEVSLWAEESVDIENPVDLIALYYNGDEVGSDNAQPVIARVEIIDKSVPQLEAHVVGNALKVQIYNNKNTLPLSVRAADESAGAVSYEVKSVSFTNSSIPEYVEPSVLDDGKTINVKIKRDYMVGTDDSSWTSFINGKYKTGFNVTVMVGGKEKSLTTENVTISFGKDKPTAKMITQESPVVIDYYSEDITSIMLSGMNVTNAISAETNASENSKGIKLENGEFNILSNGKLPKKLAKGTYKATVFIGDDENYNLPGNFNLTLPITYMVVDDTPELIMLYGKTSVVLNPAIEEDDEVWFEVKNATSDTEVEYALYDSRNKKIDLDEGEPVGIDIDLDYVHGASDGYIHFTAIQSAQFGQNYKIKLYVNNTETGKTGPEKVITMKTAAASASDPKNMGITVKGKGSIDAGVPGSKVALTFAGKNLNLIDKDPGFTVSVNGTNITGECIAADYDPETDTIYVYENSSKPFWLLDHGYALQQAEFTISVEGVDVIGPKGNFSNLTFNATYKSKILASAVTPKLGVSKVTINPAYDTVPIAIPITNLEGGIYDYNVTCLNTTKATTPFRYLNHSYDDENGIDVIYIGYDKSGVNSTAGQSFKVNITPVAPEGINKPLNGKTASMTIAILDPTKAAGKVSATSKITGSIDAIRDTTNITAALTFKNLYDPLAVVENIGCTITQTARGNTSDFSGCFNVARNGSVITITRNPMVNLTAGTYDALFNVTIKRADGSKDTLLVTSKIKVVRGTGTGSTFTPASVQLINRDYKKIGYSNVTIKDASVNGIRMISLDSAYASMFELIAKPDGTCWIRIKEGYVEYKNPKTKTPITAAVTKTVPVDVCYYGSLVPDKLKLKVVISP